MHQCNLEGANMNSIGICELPMLWPPPINQIHIVLSFAPSAAAVWHCDRERITCERNSAWHCNFFKRLVRQFFRRFLSIVALGGTPENLKIHPGPQKSTFCNPAGRHRPKRRFFIDFSSILGAQFGGFLHIFSVFRSMFFHVFPLAHFFTFVLILVSSMPPK